MPGNRYDVGQLVRCTARFTTVSSGAFIDPTAVFFQFRTPVGGITQYRFGVDAELVQDAVGRYHVDVDANDVGQWYYRYHSTGTGQAAAESGFEINESQFT